MPSLHNGEEHLCWHYLIRGSALARRARDSDSNSSPCKNCFTKLTTKDLPDSQSENQVFFKDFFCKSF